MAKEESKPYINVRNLNRWIPLHTHIYTYTSPIWRRVWRILYIAIAETFRGPFSVCFLAKHRYTSVPPNAGNNYRDRCLRPLKAESAACDVWVCVIGICVVFCSCSRSEGRHINRNGLPACQVQSKKTTTYILIYTCMYIVYMCYIYI